MGAMPLAQKLAAAWERRAPLHAAPNTNAYRLIHRAGDGFPELAVDRYNDVLVAHLYGDGSTITPPAQILRALMERAQARAVYVKYRPAQASVVSERERAALAPPVPLFGAPAEETIARENGLRFGIRPGEGLSVGLFLDMRDVRARVRAQAKGKTVLNCFAYTCGFGVAAHAGGCARAVNVDVSRAALEWGRRNYEINGLESDSRDFIAGDVFDWVKRFGKRGQMFDLVILDPPSYSTTKVSRFSAQSDYAALVASAAKVVAPGGWLMACANASEMALSAFKAKMRAGLEGASARTLRMAHEPEIDFPVAPHTHPYLKICFVQFDERR
jgi:23S rRNA (cytosine1962-C5)-methyltransferase